MNIVGKCQCSLCGAVHWGISVADAESAVHRFNKHLALLLPEEQSELYGGVTPDSIERYKKCFFCHSPSETFVFAPPGSTVAVNQPIVAPT